MPRHPHDLVSEYKTFGLVPGYSEEEARTLTKALIADEAYQNPKHRAHDTVVADVRAIYEALNEEPTE